MNLVSKIQNKLVREGSTLYVIGGNLYSREKLYNGTLSVRCIHHKAKKSTAKHVLTWMNIHFRCLKLLKCIHVNKIPTRKAKLLDLCQADQQDP